MSADQSPPKPPTAGVFTSKGMRLGVPLGGLTISMGPDGKIESSLTLHAALDVTPHWLRIAFSHLQVAEVEHPRLAPAWQRQANEDISAVLEAEFLASMQASTAAAIALDAFYAAVKGHVSIRAKTLEAWQANRTARYKQVFETLRQGFRVGKEALPKVRELLKEVYRFRDLAVHPEPKLAQPLLHPDLGGVGTEWRFVYFRLENARPIVGACLSLVAQLLNAPKDSNEGLKRHCAETQPLLQPVVEQWEARYGPLYPKPGPSDNQTGP